MSTAPLRVRPLEARDIPQVIDLSTRIYGPGAGWSVEQLESHLQVFPDGQLVATLPEGAGGQVIGMAASLIVAWDDYEITDSWRTFTAAGMFTNHDPVRGRTLYGAEVMADPAARGRGVGSALYRARRKMVERLDLDRVRAGARLRGYHLVADQMTAAAYVAEVVAGRRRDPTLTFQLRRGFTVIGVVSDYLRNDPESLGWAALIEWNRRAGVPKHHADR